MQGAAQSRAAAYSRMIAVCPDRGLHGVAPLKASRRAQRGFPEPVRLLQRLHASRALFSVAASLIWLHAISDAIVGAAYLLIPISLIWFYRRRPEIPFRWIFLVFAAFIVACGATHVIEVWTLWVPSYWLQGGVKALTAALSLLAAFSLIKALPELMTIPSPTTLNAEVLVAAARRTGAAHRQRRSGSARAHAHGGAGSCQCRSAA